MFWNKNNLFLGLLIGLLFPFVGFAFFLEIYDILDQSGYISGRGLPRDFRPRTAALLGVCLNLIPFHFYNRRRYFQSMRGIILATLVFAGVWIYFFGAQIINAG